MKVRLIFLYQFERIKNILGEWSDNIINGKGRYVWKNGNRYEGDFINDKKEGKGIYFYANGDKYDGEFRDDKQNGKCENNENFCNYTSQFVILSFSIVICFFIGMTL